MDTNTNSDSQKAPIIPDLIHWSSLSSLYLFRHSKCLPSSYLVVEEVGCEDARHRLRHQAGRRSSSGGQQTLSDGHLTLQHRKQEMDNDEYLK